MQTRIKKPAQTYYLMEFVTTLNTDFWQNVKEHYQWKKKHLVQLTRKAKYGKLQDKPLKPPYKTEELDAWITTLPEGVGIPADLYAYLTRVSREMLFFEPKQFLLNKCAFMTNRVYIATHHMHAPNCNCFGKMSDTTSPQICPSLDEEGQQKVRDFIKEQEEDYGDALCITGVCLGYDRNEEQPYYDMAKFVACNKNKVFGKVYIDTDDSYDGCWPDHEEYCESFAVFLQRKMRRDLKTFIKEDQGYHSEDDSYKFYIGQTKELHIHSSDDDSDDDDSDDDNSDDDDSDDEEN